MKTANEQLLDAMVRHQAYLLRYSGHVRNRINALLDRTESRLREVLGDKLQAFDGGGLTTPVQWQRLQRLQRQIGVIRLGAWDKAQKVLEREMVQLAYQEPQFLSAAVQNALPVTVETVIPSARMLRSIALARPFQGRVMRDWAKTMASDDVRRVSSVIQAGLVEGATNDAIVRRVVGTRLLKGSDGVTELTRRQVQAVTRTAVMHVSNGARTEFLRDNADLFGAEQFVATLDARTTPECAELDGQHFPPGKGPQPPLHYNCRSLRVAAMDGAFLGDRPAKPYTEKQLLREYTSENGLDSVTKRDQLPYGTKGDFDQWKRGRIRELVGPIPASTTYQTWLKGQSAEFQNDTLGITKAKLFRDGGLTLDKFVGRNGDTLTLAQLAQRDAAAFRAAGLDPDKFIR